MGIPPGTDLTTPEARRDLWLTAIGAAGGLLWFFVLTGGYAISQHECGQDRAWWSVALTGACLLGTLGALYGGVRRQRELRAAPPAAKRHKDARVRLMVQVGLGLNALCFVMQLGFLAPLFFLRPCE